MPDDPRDAMRAALLAQGFAEAAVDAMLGDGRPATDTVRTAVADAVAAMRQELPSSVKTCLCSTRPTRVTDESSTPPSPPSR